MMPEADLSFVLITDTFERIARTVRHLRAQAGRERIELVIVAPTSLTLDRNRPELKDFHSVQLIHVAAISSLSWARVPGIRAARAPLVALGETHAFPQPGWAEALLGAHAEGWDVVGPGITNANPATLVSWANLFLDYGPWIEPAAPREMDDLPGHNSCYRRETLVSFSDAELERLLEAETVLHQKLRAEGCRLRLEPRARLAHTNVTRWGSVVRERFSAGQRFAGARAREFSALRRLLYILGSPLIPLVRLPRILRDIERSGKGRELWPAILPALCGTLVLSALGELAGYLAGPGASMMHLSRIELDKLPHLRPGDTLGDAAP